MDPQDDDYRFCMRAYTVAIVAMAIGLMLLSWGFWTYWTEIIPNAALEQAVEDY